MSKRKGVFTIETVVILVLLVIVFQTSFARAVSHEIDYAPTNLGDNSDAKFSVQTLKYEPYPVNAGDWFDLWVKVQNIGSDDATNAVFEIIPEYPFSSSDSLVREYGIVPGTASAFQNKKPGDTNIEANQVVMKFRVKVADNAPAGESQIKFQTSADSTGSGILEYLPIEIAKEKTDFLVVLQGSDNYGTSFSVTNIGEGNANSIVVETIEDQWNFNGDRSASIGKLLSSDTTKFNIQGVPKSNSIDLKISYTDDSGVRREITKTLPVPNLSALSSNGGDPTYLKWIYGLIGIFIGVLILSSARKVHKKKRN